MERNGVVFVKCCFSRSASPNECLFRLTAPNGGDYFGTAPSHYCYDESRHPLQAEIPAGEEVRGLVAGITVQRLAGNIVRVQLPNGELYDISDNLLLPVGERSRVSLQS